MGKIKKCACCGHEFMSSKHHTKTCSDECAARWRCGIKLCLFCGKEFSVMKDSRNRKRLIRPVYCSKECREKAGIQRAVKKRREKYQNDPEYRAHVLELNARLNKLPKYKEIFARSKAKRDHRIKNAGRIDGDITLRGLFEREKGVCYLCGQKCDYADFEERVSKNGYHYILVGGEYPSIDHVVPLSKGGTHTWDNVHLAHKRCNMAKGNKYPYVVAEK